MSRYFRCTLILIFGLLFGISSEARADSVLRCDNCTASQQRSTARSGPPGLTYVIDYPNAGLTLWEVEYDGELRSNSVYPLAVEPAVYERYLYMLDAKVQAQSAQSNLIVIHYTPGQHNSTIFAGDPLGNSGYGNSNAYEVVSSVAVRNGIGIKLARAMSLTNTGNTVLDNLGITLNSVIMGMGAPNGFKIVISWKDGTKTTFIIDAASAHEAQYAPGESRDSNGQPIPDAAITTPNAGNVYGGAYRFDSGSSLDKWVQAAINYGIPVTGMRSGSNRLSCSWDGKTLNCRFN